MFFGLNLKQFLLLFILSIFSFSSYSSGGDKCEEGLSGHSTNNNSEGNSSRDAINKAMAESLSKPVEDLNSSEMVIAVKVINTFKKDGILTYEDLVRRTREYLLSMPNVGQKSVNNIEEVLAIDGLSLGMIDTELNFIMSFL